MKRGRTYLVPDILDDVRLGSSETILEFCSHAAWRRLEKQKVLGGDDHPLNRHDFKSKVNWNIRPTLTPSTVPVPSPVRAFVTALGVGRNNHRTQLEHADIKRVCLKLYSKASSRIPLSSALSASDVILAAVELGAASSVYRITSYDQLICALERVGPVLFTLPWYERFLSAEELASTTGRAEKPWGTSLGLTTLCVSGYLANGLLTTVEHGQPGWRAQSFNLLEEHFVQLASEGEVYAFDRDLRLQTLYS